MPRLFRLLRLLLLLFGPWRIVRAHHIDLIEIRRIILVGRQIFCDAARIADAATPEGLFFAEIKDEKNKDRRRAERRHENGEHQRPRHAARIEDKLRIAQRLHDGANNAVPDEIETGIQPVRFLLGLP